MDLKKTIRDIPDFPKPGIIFKDITTMLGDPDALRYCVDKMSEYAKSCGAEVVVAAESRGFIFGMPIAYKLGIPFVPIRKPGKLPSKTYKATYDLEYGTDSLEIHQDAFAGGKKVLIVDDLLATGGTTGAMVELVKKIGGNVCGVAYVIELTFLDGRKKLPGLDVFSLITY
jgi:adenine phosphoribosyltransferase